MTKPLPPQLDLPAEEPRNWEEDLADAEGPPPPVLSEEESARVRAELAERSAVAGALDAERQALAAQTELGHSIAEDVGREIALRTASAAVLDKPSSNLLDGRPHFIRMVEGEPDRCGQDGEVWPCRAWSETIGPRMMAESTGVVEMPTAASDERREAAAALLGISADRLGSILAEHDGGTR